MSTGWVPAWGHASSGILLVGEAPGEQEAALGKPFVGASGFYLDRLLRRAGISRNIFAIHNVLSCRPPGNYLVGAPYQDAAIATCAPNLDKTIRDTKPKVIVALGNTALQRLLPECDGIQRFRGFVLDRKGTWVIPTFHPSYLLPRDGQANTSRLVGIVIRDLRKALRVAQEGFSRKPVTYLLDPNADVFAMWVTAFENAYRRDPSLYLSFDIETPFKLKAKDEDEIPDTEEEDEIGVLPVGEPILRISFSYREGEAVTVPWRGDYLNAIKTLLAHPGKKVGWNVVRFDIPVIQSHGLQVNGPVYDGMWAFHMWQSDLPKGLEFVASLFTDLEPWKHLSDSRPAHYNAVDADAQLRNMLALERELKDAGQWDVFLKHMVDLDPLLMTMGQRGVTIDVVAQNALKAELEGEQVRLITAAQEFVPELLKHKILWKRRPDKFPTTPVTEPAKVKRCSKCFAEHVTKSTHMIKGGKKNPCHDATIEIVESGVLMWEEVEDFNPNSRDQMLAYAQHFGHPVPENHKTHRPTIDKKVLERFAKRWTKKHPIYATALELRGVKKTLGTYVIGFAPDREGLIHTTYGHHPSSLRLSSRAVNLTNVSHRGGVKYADRVRRTIVPRAGHVFVEADSSAIEAVMTGFFMGSDEYIALAKRGIHDYLTCLEVGIPFDGDGIQRSKKEFKIIRDRNKQTVHGVSYGMTAYLLHMSYPDTFPRIKDAQDSIDHFLSACPGLAQWQHNTRVFAHKQAFLQNPWGYRHYFYDVFAGKDKNGEYLLGGDANRCVSFLPQSSAAAFMKDNVTLLAQTKFWPMPANGLVHDSYCLEVRDADVSEAVDTLRKILTRPIAEMGGLTIGCEVKVGKNNWNDLVIAA